MSTRYEVAWQHRGQTQTHVCPFRDDYHAGEFFDQLQKLGGLNWLALREIQNHELRRWEAAEQA